MPTTSASRTPLVRHVLVKRVLWVSGLLWAGSASAHDALGWHAHAEEWAAVAWLGAPWGVALVLRWLKGSSQGRS